MQKPFTGILTLAVLSLAAMPVMADNVPAPILVEVVMPNLEPGAVGELLGESPTSLTVLDLKSNKQRVFVKTAVQAIKRDLSDDQAIAAVDLGSLVAWKIHRLSSQTPIQGQIARVTDTALYVTVGANAGLVTGTRLNVVRVQGTIVDPSTGKAIAQERPRIAQLEVTEVQDAFAKAKRVGEMEVKLDVGDTVETSPLKMSVAVIPPVDVNGKEIAEGVSIAEDLATTLASRDIPVVERGILTSVLKELALQNSDLVDPFTARRFGRQLGASTILSGKIVPDGAKRFKIHLRLIDVETGKVLLAAAQGLPDTSVNAKPVANAADTPAPYSAESVKLYQRLAGTTWRKSNGGLLTFDADLSLTASWQKVRGTWATLSGTTIRYSAARDHSEGLVVHLSDDGTKLMDHDAVDMVLVERTPARR